MVLQERNAPEGRRTTDMRWQRFAIVVVMGTLIALVVSKVTRPPHLQVKLSALSMEPSGLFDAGAELPFVSLTLLLPGFDDPGIQFSQEPFGVECKVQDRWVKVENRARVTWSRQNELSFLILPGTEACRLHFQYQREMLQFRILRAVLPREQFCQYFPSRFSRWVWLESPVGPTLIRLMYHSIRFARPPRWTQLTAEIRIPQQLAEGEAGVQQPAAPTHSRAGPAQEARP